jgi:uncharacterized damage-inducible protein DinB
MTINDTIAYSLHTSRMLLHRYLDDLSPQEFLHRPTPTANCAAWLVGHLILGDRGAMKRLGLEDLPILPEGFEKRFSRDEGCPQALEFGDVGLLRPLFDQHRDRLIERVKSASAQDLSRRLEQPHPLFQTVGESLLFNALHVSVHAGQMTIIRRSLGRPPLV